MCACKKNNDDANTRGQMTHKKRLHFHQISLIFLVNQRVCDAILKQLDDKSNDVQSIAVKW